MQTVELGGGRRATMEVLGRGEPLLFFPGGPGYGGDIVRIDGELLAERFTVYLMDPPGSGGSTPPADPKDYSPEGTARFYEDVRVALGLDEVNVGGHSFGSLVALAYAALFPQVTRRCLAVATRVMGAELDVEEGGAGAAEEEAALARHSRASWYPRARATLDAWTERVLATDSAAEVDAMMREVLPLYLANPDRPDVRGRMETWIADDWTTNLDAVKEWENGLYQYIDLRPLLAQITAPTLLVAGEHDFICGPAHAIPVAAAIPDAQLVVINDVGHVPALEAPESYRDAVLGWADRTAAATVSINGEEVG